MKIVLLCGNNFNQIALANRIHTKFALAGLVVEKRISVNKEGFISKVVRKLKEYLLFSEIVKAWLTMINYYKHKFPTIPNVPLQRVANVNSPEVIKFVLSLQPDLIMVSGTSIIKKEVLKKLSSAKVINLHTGLSPYIKGGPNCTNWCLATDQFHLIGNTVMWIDAGIDSGNIITTELVPLTGTESLGELQIKVMEHAHQLYLQVVQLMIEDLNHVPSVPQEELGQGQLFLTKMWGDSQKKSLLKNIANNRFFEIISDNSFQEKRRAIKMVRLPSSK